MGDPEDSETEGSSIIIADGEGTAADEIRGESIPHDPNDQTGPPGDLASRVHIVENPILRAIYFIVGTISLGLGIIGIVLPLLPTTPFLIVTAFFYSMSSERAYIWLMTNRTFGAYLRDYFEGKGIPKHVKVKAIAFLWITIMISTIFFIPILWVRLLLPIIAALVSWHILSLPTKEIT